MPSLVKIFQLNTASVIVFLVKKQTNKQKTWGIKQKIINNLTNKEKMAAALQSITVTCIHRRLGPLQ